MQVNVCADCKVSTVSESCKTNLYSVHPCILAGGHFYMQKIVYLMGYMHEYTVIVLYY